MAKTFGSQIDLQKIPVLGLVPQSSATVSPPASPVNGQLWYDSTVNRLKVYENGSWTLSSQTGTILSGSTAGGGLAGTYPNPTLAANSVVTATITDANVTYAKIQNVAASSLLGNPTGSAAAPSGITLAADHSFSGTTLQLGAFTGDITKVAGSLATTIANSAVTYAKIQNVTATARILGRLTAGAGVVEELSYGTDFTNSGTTLQTAAFTGDVTKTAGGSVTTIANNAVTVGKLATSVNLNSIATANAATADITASGFKITNLATPTSAADAATKAYVDSVAAGLDPKGSVRAASTAAVTVTYNATGGTSARGQLTAMPNAIDGVTLAASDRVLLKNQATGAQNGIWVVTTLGTGANGVWDRATDFDQDPEVTAGAFTFVEEGTTNDNTGWVLTTNNPIIIGGASGTALVWAQFSGGAAYTAGNGLSLTGNSFAVVGTTNRISVGATVDISSAYVGQATITTLGTVTTGTWTGTTIATANGGTGIATNPTVGGVTFGASTSAQGYTAAGTSGMLLHSAGSGTPTWSLLNLAAATEVTGTLALGNGGTGGTTAATARASLGTTGKYAATLGALAAGVETTITHSLGSSDVITQFRDATTGYEIMFSWRVVDANTVGVTADVAYSASAVRAVVVG